MTRLRRASDGSEDLVVHEETLNEWTIEVRWFSQESYRVRCLPPGSVGYSECTRAGFMSIRTAIEAGRAYVLLSWSGMRVKGR